MRSLRLAFVMGLLLGCPPAFAAGFDVAAGAELAYDDNVFLLDESQKTELDSGEPQNNDQLDDMESSSDIVVGLGVRVDWSTKSLAGRTTRFRLEPGVALFLANSRCTHGTLAMSIDQKLWKRGEAYLQGSFTPSRFKKNYFVDGTDTDVPADGVSGSEKDYEPGVVSDAGVIAGVRAEVGKLLELHAEGGMGTETWPAPLRNRDQRALLVELGTDLKLGKRVKAGLDVQLVDARSPAGEEVVVNDRVRSVIDVDRSYASTRASAGVGVEATKTIDVRLGASFRQRSYSADGASDPFRDRVDQRIGFGAGVKAELGALDLGLGVEHLTNSTERPNDPGRTGDPELDYAKNVYSLTALWRF